MQQTLNFLKKIKKNNNREWFEKNKPLYLEVKQAHEEVVQQVINNIAKFDPKIAGLEAAKTTFRIYKDVRFSKDKTPYKSNMGASINPGGKKSDIPGYYLHVEPGNSFLAGGCFMPMPDKLAAIRQEIDYNYADFKKILANKEFKKYFAGISDEGKLVNPPKGYDKENPAVEILKNKSFILVHNIDDKMVLSKDYPKHVATIFKAMHPFVLFLREAMK
ncbi:MAG: DUF2461 domain-containing protein [Bacteroidia bacterium]